MTGQILNLFVCISGEVKVTMKGCFSNPNDCNRTECIDTTMGTKNNLNYCCCKVNMCNQEYRWAPNVTVPPDPVVPVQQESTNIWLVCAFVTVFLVAAGVLVIFFVKRRKQSMFNEIPTVMGRF